MIIFEEPSLTGEDIYRLSAEDVWATIYLIY